MPTRVIIADDETIQRMDLKDVLTKQGYLVVGEAGDGLSAVNLAREIRPDLVIMDIRMPDMDGIEVLKKIREERPEIEVIIITGYQTVDTAVKSIKLGAFDYIEKPFTPDVLIFAVSKAMEHLKR